MGNNLFNFYECREAKKHDRKFQMLLKYTLESIKVEKL